jgi:hypothetical protein
MHPTVKCALQHLRCNTCNADAPNRDAQVPSTSSTCLRVLCCNGSLICVSKPVTSRIQERHTTSCPETTCKQLAVVQQAGAIDVATGCTVGCTACIPTSGQSPSGPSTECANWQLQLWGAHMVELTGLPAAASVWLLNTVYRRASLTDCCTG